MTKIRSKCRRGAALVVALVTLLVITSTMAAIIHGLMLEFRHTRQVAGELQAQWLADAAVARAAAQLQSDPDYKGETWRAAAGSTDDAITTGVAEIRVEKPADSPDLVRIKVEARFPDQPVRRILASRSQLMKNSNPEPSAGRSPQETAP